LVLNRISITDYYFKNQNNRSHQSFKAVKGELHHRVQN